MRKRTLTVQMAVLNFLIVSAFIVNGCRTETMEPDARLNTIALFTIVSLTNLNLWCKHRSVDGSKCINQFNAGTGLHSFLCPGGVTGINTIPCTDANIYPGVCLSQVSQSTVFYNSSTQFCSSSATCKTFCESMNGIWKDVYHPYENPF